MKSITLPSKKLGGLIASLLTATLATNATASELTVYGKANLSINHVDDGDSEWQVNSNASRLGFKGDYQVNDGLEAFYKMEFETYMDDGDKNGNTFGQRNIYAGFRGNYGQILVGKHDSPLKLAQGNVDRFNDLHLADMKNYIQGEDRLDNIVMYTSPSFSCFSATLAMVAGEDAENGDSGLADGQSISVKYQHNLFTASLSNNSAIDSQDTTRFVLETEIVGIELGLLLQTAENLDDLTDEDSIVFSGQYKLGDGYVLKAQYGQTDYSNGNTDSQIAFGIDKKLDKNTKLFVYYSTITSDVNTEIATTSVIEDQNVFGAGFEIKF